MRARLDSNASVAAATEGKMEDDVEETSSVCGSCLRLDPDAAALPSAGEGAAAGGGAEGGHPDIDRWIRGVRARVRRREIETVVLIGEGDTAAVAVSDVCEREQEATMCEQRWMR